MPTQRVKGKKMKAKINENTKRKMQSGIIYDPSAPELMLAQMRAIKRVDRFNKIKSGPIGLIKRARLLKKMFESIGEDCYIEPPLHASWGCGNVSFGKNVYANFNLTLVDDGPISIGDYTMIGPNVTIATAAHPIAPELRQKSLQYNLPVKIGANCWIGAGAVILPGVTIGDGSVIGAGSVVNKDIPANVVAVGNPCKVLRPITQNDRLFYDKTKPVPQEYRQNGF